MIRATLRRPPARRGATLIVVLGLLALFAAVGLSFVMLADSKAVGSKNDLLSRNESGDPDPAAAANGFLAQLIFDVDDTNPAVPPASALYGQSLARSRFGRKANTTPFAETGLTFGTNPPWAGGPAMDQTQLVNFAAAFTASGGVANPNNWNKAVPWTYPDRNNFHLAYYDPVTDQVTVPSFHRNDLGNWIPGDPNNFENQGAAGRYKTLRPRTAENPLFPSVPANASDGTYTGDVANLKWLTGNSGQKNDSLWMDPNLPIREWRGKRYKALVAPLVLDLGGKINLAVAGNNKGIGAVHGSHHGWGAWEQNPTGLLNYPANANNPADPTAITQLQNLLNLRYSTANPPATGLNRFGLTSGGTLNGGLMTPQYARIDASGAGTGAADPMTLPGAGGFTPFPTYSGRFAASISGPANPTLSNQVAAVHGQSFSPYQWKRQAPSGTPWVPSMEDQLRLSLPISGPKGVSGYNGQFASNTKLTTLFSVSQRWGEITVNTATGTAKLATIDITRPLPDYRTNTAVVHSPLNLGNFAAAQLARQNLARDIFVRLLAVLTQPAGFPSPGSPVIDGTNVAYDPTSANVVITYAANLPQFATLRQWAQFAVNMVDQIDNDDISTPFAWNTAVLTDIVFGVEVPKLVLNEAYCELDNDRTEKPPALVALTMKRPAKLPHKKLYWLELHNPLPAADPTLADGGAARLQYDPAVTTVPDSTGAQQAAPFAAPVYKVAIAEVAKGAAANPLSTALSANPSNVALDLTAVAGMTMRIEVNNYKYDANAPAPAATLANDNLNVVQPVGAGAAVQGGNQGYYVMGPRDNFPGGGVTTTLCMPDDPGFQAAPATVNAMMYSTDASPLAKATIGDQALTTSVVVLRRLANPYLAEQSNPAVAGYNPYIIVDYIENLPTRDRAEYDDTDVRGGGFAKSNGATIGRKHPYAAAPYYGQVNQAFADQAATPVIANNPNHTFFTANSNIENAAPAAPNGLAWLAHLDREPVNALELSLTSAVSPGMLTQSFYSGTLGYQAHLNPVAATATTPVLFDTTNYPTMFRAFDQLGVGNRMPGVPLGGREPGRVNINTAGDPAILQAVLDPQSGNTFATVPGYVTNTWAQLLASRTPGAGNVPAATSVEGGNDRPFQPGGAIYTDTLFRRGSVLANYPALFNSAAASTHKYFEQEPLRKGWNNLTTVSDGFLVVFTVGFFEVDTANRLGKELFDKVPGDLRAQYAGIVDRTALTVDPNPTPALPAGQFALGPKPWETKLSADCTVGANQIVIQSVTGAGTVYDDGNPVTIQPGNLLWVGYSGIAQTGDGEWVKVLGVAAGPTAGTSTITLDNTPPAAAPAVQYSTTIQRFHGGGTRVSNAVVGNPGPQPAFDYRDTTGKYRGVLPYFMRMVP